MQSKDAINALCALAQEHRLSLFRLLVQAGKDGVAAGSLAAMLDIPIRLCPFISPNSPELG